MQTIVTDVRGLSVCQSLCLSRGSSRFSCAGVVRCSLCQIILVSCLILMTFWPLLIFFIVFVRHRMHEMKTIAIDNPVTRRVCQSVTDSLSHVANFQPPLAFTMGHIPTKLHQFLTRNFWDFVRRDRRTHRQTPSKTTSACSMRAGAVFVSHNVSWCLAKVDCSEKGSLVRRFTSSNLSRICFQGIIKYNIIKVPFNPQPWP